MNLLVKKVKARRVPTAFLAGLVVIFSLTVCPVAMTQAQTESNSDLEPAKMSSPLRSRLRNSADKAADGRIAVIVRVNPEALKSSFRSRRLPGFSKDRVLDSIGAYAAELDAQQIRRLARSRDVEYVTWDAPLFSFSSNPDREAVGAALVSQMGWGRADGVGVALFDSGIDDDHDDLENSVAARADFASSDSSRRDPYGHGTAVAGIIGGSGKESNGSYRGVAPGVHFIDVRVISGSGAGQTSNLIKSIEWVIAHKYAYNIRVANLSLGHPAFEPYFLDPLCQAVQQMVDAGIVVVASAGNLGKLPNYPEIWGGITSPGTSPSVITVGGVNTKSTSDHSDDVATSYSSRGPTFSGLFKPDLSAPANRIPAPLAKDSFFDEHLGFLRLDDHDYIGLSGTSMAAAYVSGTAALMINQNPQLTPDLVKSLLMLSAIKLTGPHALEQGNGLLNVPTAVQLAQQTDVASRHLSGSVPLSWQLNGKTVWSGGAMAFGGTLLYTPLVDADSSPVWGSGFEWAKVIFPADSWAFSESVFDFESPIWPGSLGGGISLGGYDYGGGGIWTDSVLWIDNVFNAEGIIWAESVLWVDRLLKAESVVWAEGVVWVDSAIWAEAIVWADSLRDILTGDSAFPSSAVPIGTDDTPKSDSKRRFR